MLERSAAGTTTIVLCLLASIAEGIDLQAAGVSAVGIARELQMAPEQLGAFFSASTLGLLFGALLGGRLADSVGRKTVLVASVAMFGLASLITGLSWDAQSLVVSRLLTGLGLGGALPMMVTLTAESSPEERRSANVTMVIAGAPLGGILISLFALASDPAHWRLNFVVGGVLPLILAPIMMFMMPESPAFERSKRLHSVGSSSSRATPVLRDLLVLLSEGRALRTFLLWGCYFLSLLLIYLLLNWLPALMVENGLTHSQASATQMGFNLGGALAALTIGRFMAGRQRRPIVTFTFIAIPLLVVALAQLAGGPLTTMLFVLFLGAAMMAAQAFLYAVTPESYPTEIRGFGVGTAIAIGRIGAIVGPALGGYLAARQQGNTQLFMDLAPLALATCICALLLVWRAQARTRADLDQF
jgi:AAHS family 3-hydroxyphenylpropionic acid transporter